MLTRRGPTTGVASLSATAWRSGDAAERGADATTSIDAPARGEVLLRDVLVAGEPGFGRFVFEPDHLLEAVESIPAEPAVDDPGRFVINGVISYHPKGWERSRGGPQYNHNLKTGGSP